MVSPRIWRLGGLAILSVIAFCGSLSAEINRVSSGLQALYDFSSSSGDLVMDRSGIKPALDLKIAKPGAVRWSEDSLQVTGETRIESRTAAKKIIDASKRSGEISIEAWIRPASTGQKGPARIVTLSKNGNERNFTLGQDSDKFDVRLRSTKTSKNGIPSTATKSRSVKTSLTHVLYTRNRSGQAGLYLNGKRVANRNVGGDLKNWDASHKFALADELSGDRQWKGTYHLVAVYSRSLSTKEVLQNFKAGPGGITEAVVATPAKHPNAELFKTKVAAILSNHCLECHDASTRKGKLDLSTKAGAFASGKHGPSVIAGNSAKSPLWEEVEFDDMPEDREPLSSEEKKILKQWIDGGAQWTLDVIDPALFAHDARGGQIWVQRLTVSEYIETVRSAVGVDVSKEASRLLPPDLRADGFSNTAYNLSIDLKHIDAYAQLAETIVNQMDIKAFAGRFTNKRQLEDKPMFELIEKMGRWILRGPLEEYEVHTFRGIASTVAAAGGTYEESVSFVLEAMLQSPRFIYRMENQKGDGSMSHVGDYELASRMSYILWGGPPDEKLYKAAENGELTNPENASAQVVRMLADRRAIERSRQFASEWLDLARLATLAPNSTLFPGWSAEIAADMRQESLAFFEEVAWNQKRPLADLLNAQVTFLTPRLAVHYGLEPRGDGWTRYELASLPSRGGLLTQGSVLTVGGDTASMVSRGLFVLHELLRGEVKDPPPCVDTTPIPTKAGLTQRAIALERIADKTCGGCHSKFEPLAFGLEKFDGLGAFHDRDIHGNELRDDGNILFPGTAEAVSYETSAELMNLLAGSKRVQETLTWKVAQFALGRPLGIADAPVLEKVHKQAQDAGGTYAAVVSAIVLSDLVQLTRTELANHAD